MLFIMIKYQPYKGAFYKIIIYHPHEKGERMNRKETTIIPVNYFILKLINDLNLQSLIKMTYYKPYFEAKHYDFYEQWATVIEYYLRPFKRLQKPEYPFTCYSDLKKILKDTFELHNSHPTLNYTIKLNKTILLFTKLQIYYSNVEGEYSINSRKCNHIIALCKEIKKLRECFCRRAKHNHLAYVLK